MAEGQGTIPQQPPGGVVGKKQYYSYTREPVEPSSGNRGFEILSSPTEQLNFLRKLPANCEIIDVTNDPTIPPSHTNALTMHPGSVGVYHGQLLKGGRFYYARARQPNISGLGVLQRPVYTVGQALPNAVSLAGGLTITTGAPTKDKRLIALEMVFWTTATRTARASGVLFTKNITLYDVYRPNASTVNITSIILNALAGSTASDVVFQRNITIPKEHEFEVIISAVANCWFDIFLTYVMESG